MALWQAHVGGWYARGGLSWTLHAFGAGEPAPSESEAGLA